VVLSNFGNALRALGELEAAETAERRAIAVDPDLAEAWNNLGAALHAQHKLEEAALAYERAVGLSPSLLDAWFNLGNLRKDQGRLEEGIASWRQALAIDPALAQAHNNIGNALYKLGKIDDAIEAFRHAVALAPGFAEARHNLAMGLRQRGDFANAIAAFDDALAIEPAYALAGAGKAATLLAAGNPSAALAVADDCLRMEPHRQQGIAYRALALAELGRSKEADFINDYAGLIHVTELSGSNGSADFNGELTAAVRSHPTLTLEPGEYLTRGGRLTANLLLRPSPVINRFEEMLRQTIDRYIGSLVSDPAHPFLSRIPKSYSLKLRATILRAGGWHPEHLHEHEWLSGVYYPELPADTENGGGWIEFGRPDYALSAGSKLKLRAIKPEVGMLLLFPSYFFHRTIPFAGGDERISLAFDLSHAP
jgi:tetratricopeptide (TPR) repeat protein